MYHPPRGGVRGGADQFNWEDVKSDKHRENYLGHSVKAPVGRWQKGKDLLWYSKDRSSDKDTGKRSDALEISAIKRVEEEAMLAALGHKIVRKETQPLTKEEMAEVLKRNATERDDLNVERVEGVGVMSGRAVLVNSGNQKRKKAEGMNFETSSPGVKNTENSVANEKHKKNREKKMSKKHKKEKKKHKKKKKRKHSVSESESTDDGNDESVFDKADRGRNSKHHFDESQRDSKKSHKSLSEMEESASVHKARNRHDSDSECDSVEKKVKHHSKEKISYTSLKSDRNSKKRRHDSSSDSDNNLKRDIGHRKKNKK